MASQSIAEIERRATRENSLELSLFADGLRAASRMSCASCGLAPAGSAAAMRLPRDVVEEMGYAGPSNGMEAVVMFPICCACNAACNASPVALGDVLFRVASLLATGKGDAFGLARKPKGNP